MLVVQLAIETVGFGFFSYGNLWQCSEIDLLILAGNFYILVDMSKALVYFRL